MFISELCKILFLSKSQEIWVGVTVLMERINLPYVYVRKCRLGGQITGYAFPLPSALSVCYFKGSHVDTALGSQFSYIFNASPIVFSSGLWHYIKSYA